MEQLSLFDLGVDMSALRQQRTELAAAATLAPNTRRAYDSDFRRFSSWCARAGRQPLPCSADTLALYLTSVISESKSVASADRYCWAIARLHTEAGHPSPVGQEVRDVLSGGRRTYGSASPAAKLALTPAELRQICRSMMDESTPACIRDRALLLVGFATGVRRCEASALDLVDVSLLKKNRLIVRIRRSKTDPDGRGREIGVFPGRREETCPARALTDWLKFRGQKAGALFTQFRGDGKLTPARIAPSGVARIVKAAVERVGLDPKLYAGHSLRAGCATAGYEAGFGDSAIMKRTGHRTEKVLRRYLRSAELFSGPNPLAKAL